MALFIQREIRQLFGEFGNHFTAGEGNCTCREVVDVDVTTPAAGAGIAEADENTTVFGVPKFAGFSMLKNSARNCRRSFSKTAVFFSPEKSSSASPGPIKVSRPTFPYVREPAEQTRSDRNTGSVHRGSADL